MLVGGDSIDDTAVLGSGAMGEVLGAAGAPSTVGTWLRGFKWSNVRQLDAVSRAQSGDLNGVASALFRGRGG
jgi:hypothetical protein